MSERLLKDLIHEIEKTSDKKENLIKSSHYVPALKLMNDMTTKVINSNIYITEPNKVLDILRIYYRGIENREIVTVVSFNSQMELIGYGPVAWGDIDHVHIAPAQVFEEVFKNHAKYFIVAHNHPSNHVQPSAEDLIILETIRNIGVMLDRPLKDFLILSGSSDEYYSHRDHVYDL